MQAMQLNNSIEIQEATFMLNEGGFLLLSDILLRQYQYIKNTSRLFFFNLQKTMI